MAQIAPLVSPRGLWPSLAPQNEAFPPSLQSRERQRTGKERSDSRTRSVRHCKPRRRRAVSAANGDLTGKGNARAASLRRAEKRSESDARNGKAVSDSPLEGAALSVYAKGSGGGAPCIYFVGFLVGNLVNTLCSFFKVKKSNEIKGLRLIYFFNYLHQHATCTTPACKTGVICTTPACNISNASMQRVQRQHALVSEKILYGHLLYWTTNRHTKKQFVQTVLKT